MTIIKIVQDDQGYDLNFSLQNSDTTPFDLTGVSVSLATQHTNATNVNFTKPMTVISQAGGTCKYTIASGDFPIAGTYNAQIIATTVALIQTFEDIQIVAKAKIPLSV